MAWRFLWRISLEHIEVCKMEKGRAYWSNGCEMFLKSPVMLCADMKHTYNGILYDRGNIWAVYRLIQTFSIHNQLFHTGSCGVSNTCFLYSQALQHASYLLSRLPRAARRRAQSTASSVARRLAWPRATSAGKSACSVSICAHSLTRRLTLNQVSPYLSFLSLKQPF